MTGNAPVSPFFIVGCGRSGTTLLRTMLNHHPDIAIPVESLFLIDYLRADDSISKDRIASLIIRDHGFKRWQVDISYEALIQAASVKAMIDYMHEAYVLQQNKRYWGQKTPRFIRYWKLIKSFYPDARFIHLIRDPRATVNSLINSSLHRSNCLYGAKRWALDVGEGLELKAVYPDDTLEIYYEDLVTEPEEVLIRVCEYLDIAYSDQMLDYHNSGKLNLSPISHQVHRNLMKPPKTDRISAWENHLSRRQIEIIEYMVNDVMANFSRYERMYPLRPVNRGERAFYTIHRFVNLGWQIMYRVFRWTGPLYSFAWRKVRLGLLWKDSGQINY